MTELGWLCVIAMFSLLLILLVWGKDELLTEKGVKVASFPNLVPDITVSIDVSPWLLIFSIFFLLVSVTYYIKEAIHGYRRLLPLTILLVTLVSSGWLITMWSSIISEFLRWHYKELPLLSIVGFSLYLLLAVSSVLFAILLIRIVRVVLTDHQMPIDRAKVESDKD